MIVFCQCWSAVRENTSCYPLRIISLPSVSSPKVNNPSMRLACIVHAASTNDTSFCDQECRSCLLALTTSFKLKESLWFSRYPPNTLYYGNTQVFPLSLSICYWYLDVMLDAEIISKSWKTSNVLIGNWAKVCSSLVFPRLSGHTILQIFLWL